MVLQQCLRTVELIQRGHCFRANKPGIAYEFPYCVEVLLLNVAVVILLHRPAAGNS